MHFALSFRQSHVAGQMADQKSNQLRTGTELWIVNSDKGKRVRLNLDCTQNESLIVCFFFGCFANCNWYMCLKIENYYLKYFIKVCIDEKIDRYMWNVV